MSRIRQPLPLFAVVAALLLGFVEGASAADRMYWTDALNGTIQRAYLDGSGVQLLVNTGAGPSGIALDLAGRKMYWAEADGQKIRRANLDGSAVEDLVLSVGPFGIALDVAAGKVYWTDVFLTGYIQRANLNGTGVENLNTTVGARYGIALDVAGGKMYWTNRSWQSIERSNLDGTGSAFVIVGLADPWGIALDAAGGKMYWAEPGSQKIRRANLDGSAIEDLIPGPGPYHVALDVGGGKIYWIYSTGDGIPGGNKIQRANLDGSNVEDLVTGLGFPAGIALELGPAVTVTIDIKPGSSPNSINLKSKGVVPVAILGSQSFNVVDVDVDTVTFAGAVPQTFAYEDVNSDGISDLILHFETHDLQLTGSSTQATLTGKLKDGESITGTDSVRIIP